MINDGLSARARLFNITRGSFIDGYGIRTTIFLKGCPLRCKWCCNPEGQKFTPELRFIEDRCKDCGKCIDKCANSALSITDGRFTIDRKVCQVSGECISACWYDAIQIFGKESTAEDVFNDIIKDKIFFEDSGGGLTIGGGEATCYPEFCLEMIERCHEAGISVAIDSCGYMTHENSFEVLAKADFVLLDIKGLDNEQHIRNTGVSNKPILETLRRLEEIDQHVIIRYPMIPGYNLGEAENIAEFLTHYSCVKRVDLIGYHKFGESKYAEIGMEYTVEGESMEEKERERVLEIFLAKGLNAQIGG